MVICPDCGKEVPKEKFCKNCGAYIANIEETLPVANNVQMVPVSTEDSESKAEITEDIAISSKTDVKFCYNCGSELAGDFRFCPNCGQDLKSKVTKSNNEVATSGDKNIILAIILSVFLPGLGQIYLGLDHKGSIFLIAYIISAILILLIIGFLLCSVIWIWALIDTIISTNALNRGEKVKDKLL